MKREKGRRGEVLAANALQRAGYTILERNWRCATGEIDLVAQHRKDFVFVEVRARYTGSDAALESITPAKAERLQRLALEYLEMHGLANVSFRIDVAAVNLAGKPSVEIIENAVGW